MRRSMKLLMCFWSLLLLSPLVHAADKQTTLRVGTPNGTFVDLGGVHGVKHVEVTVRNAGDVPAQNIRVTATLPDGQTIDLLGPETLQRNQSAVYKNDGFEPVTSNKKITAQVSCSNCRR